jgi:hypothetical protein
MTNNHSVTIRSTPLDFKRGYIRALFLEDERWATCIEKYWMIVPGSRLNKLENKRDLALKEKLADQVHPDTYLERKAYYEAWVNAKCCADDCDRYCDDCHGIKFERVPVSIAKPFDPDVRRFMERYHRFWITSEQDKALKIMKGDIVHGDGREVFDQADSNDVIWDGERKGFGRPCQRKEDSSNPYQTQKESFLWPGSGKMAFEKSLEY